MSKRSNSIWYYLSAVLIVFAAWGVGHAASRDLASALPLVTAFYTSLSLIFLMGFIIGATASWLMCRKHHGRIGGDHA